MQNFNPPPPQPPPQRPLPHQRIWPWFRQLSKRAKVIGCVMLILVCSLCVCVSVAATTTPTPTVAIPTATAIPTDTATTIPTSTPNTAKVSPQVTEYPTDTPAPTQAPSPTQTQPSPTKQTGLTATHGTPHLGGPLSDFIGAYGQPNSHGTPGASYHFLTVGSIDSIIVGTIFSKTNVDDVEVNATNGNAQTSAVGWTPSDAKARCMTFAPSDAQFKQQFIYADNSGFDLVFYSAQLGHDFSADSFVDGQQNQVKAGMFDVSYLYTQNGDTQHITGCDLIIGTQQTTG